MKSAVPPRHGAIRRDALGVVQPDARRDPHRHELLEEQLAGVRHVLVHHVGRAARAADGARLPHLDVLCGRLRQQPALDAQRRRERVARASSRNGTFGLGDEWNDQQPGFYAAAYASLWCVQQGIPLDEEVGEDTWSTGAAGILGGGPGKPYLTDR